MAEWDLIVSEDGVPAGAADSLYVIAFGDGVFGPPAETSKIRMTGPPSICRLLVSPAREFTIPGALPAQVSQLVIELAEAAKAAGRKPIDDSAALGLALLGRRGKPEGNSIITEGRDREHVEKYSQQPVDAVVPFLATAREGFAVAGSWVRKGGLAEIWSLPEYADRQAWIKAAVQVWSEQAPDRFPRAQWRESAEWATKSEIDLHLRRKDVAQSRAKAVEEFDRQLLDLDKALSVARETAEAGPRALLTAQGDVLVTAVENALTALGFKVRNMDRETPQNDRREDLRVGDSGSDWTSIVEVRGYKSGGAAVSDLLRIGRFAVRFTAETKEVPGARWYIVNQFAGKDPVVRPPAFRTNPDELREFAEDGGLVIDTTDLFRLARSVEMGEVSQDAARQSLIAGRGRYEPPPPARPD